MKRILLLATGGTIASVQGKDGLTPGITDKDLVGYLPENNEELLLHSINLMNLDSTNMQPEYWLEIARTIYNKYDQYDGFVITHGTDTLGYTSAALSYILQSLAKPVIITGSMVPIDFDGTDAKKNMVDAIRFACENVCGVYVVFDGKVISGTRAVKVRSKSYNAFMSINYPYIARIEGSEVVYLTNIPVSKSGPLKLDTSICSNVFVLKLFPGITPEVFDYIKQSFRGVVIESYGNGGIPFEKRNLLPKINELIEAGIAVVITTQCLEEGTDLQRYEVGRKISKKFIISSRDMNTEAIVTKLMWVLGKTNNLDQVKKMMETPIANDLQQIQENDYVVL
ncbi:asparaginase [Metabacillus rhizolycopersici]|uniref:asparaginase n=1 Tax=Metabacillus rhizolycopersici TaxID=2875709 RepID=A0ABS7UYR0_9BACI|nr:asparaginase [Metabacillus rhizolycopersici]MBZ5753465.1 asparaginase [Metabacillus rhizolycopersici]